MSIVIDDEFLYTYVPQAEQAMLERIPKESELHHHFSRRFRRNMRALLRDERRMPETRKFVYWCKVAAAICGCSHDVLWRADERGGEPDADHRGGHKNLFGLYLAADICGRRALGQGAAAHCADVCARGVCDGI